jgi:hypothetical protein
MVVVSLMVCGESNPSIGSFFYVSTMHLPFSKGVRMSLFYSTEQTYSADELLSFQQGLPYSVER